MTVEDRIEKLELELKRIRQQKRMAWRMAALLIFLMAVVVYPQDNSSAQGNVTPEIRARQIVLVDESGRPQSIPAMGKEGPGLASSDENGEMR